MLSIMAAAPSTSTPTPTISVLINIIPGPGIRPLQPDGQYYPRHAIQVTRQQWLKTMLAPHDLIELIPCLNPWNGKALPELFIATFRDFDAYHGALSSWNYTELDPNAFIRMMVFLNTIEEDTKTTQLLDPIHALTTDEPPKAFPALPPYHPENLFEDCWAALDPDHWDQRRRRIEYMAGLPHYGAWLYYSQPGSPSFYSDPMSYSFEMPAVLEYDFLGRNLGKSRKKEVEEPVTMIDWDATRQRGKLSLQLNSSFTKYMEQLKANSPSTSSEEVNAFELENEAPPDTPNTSPPTSVRTDSDPFFSHGVKPMSLEDFKKQLGREISLTSTTSHPQPDIESMEEVAAPATGLMSELQTLMSRLPTYSDEDLGMLDTRKEIAALWIPEPGGIGDPSNKHSQSSDAMSIHNFAKDGYSLQQRGSPVEPFKLQPFGYGPVAPSPAENTTYLFTVEMADWYAATDDVKSSSHNAVAAGLAENTADHFTDQRAAWYAAADDVKSADHNSQAADDNLVALMDRYAASGVLDYGINQRQQWFAAGAAMGDHDYSVADQFSPTELIASPSNEPYIDLEQAWYASLLADPNIEKVYTSTVQTEIGEEFEPVDTPQASLSATPCDNELSTANDMAEDVAGSADLSTEKSPLVNVADVLPNDDEDSEVAALSLPAGQQPSDDGIMVPSSLHHTPEEHGFAERGTIQMIGEPNIPTTCDTSNLWVKLFMLPVFDYFSLGLLPTLIHHPIFSLLVFLVLYMASLGVQNLKDENERLRHHNGVLRDMCDSRDRFGNISWAERDISG